MTGEGVQMKPFAGSYAKLFRRPVLTTRTTTAFLGLSISFALGLIARLQMANYGYYLDGFDSYFHYYATSVILNDLNAKGISGLFDFFKTVDYKAWYPVGLNLATLTYAGMYYTSIFLYEFVTRVLGVNISLYDYLVIQPAFFGAMLVFPAYLIGNKVRGVGTGIMAALSAAVIPDILSRTSLGSYRHEPFSLLGGTFAIYFIMKSYDGTLDKRRSLMYAMLAGLMLGYANIVWGGGKYFNGIAAVSFVAIPLIMGTDYSKSLNALAIFAVDLSIGMAFPNPGLAFMTNATVLAMAAGAAGGLVITMVAKRLPDRSKIAGKWLVAGVAAVAALALGLAGLVPGLAGKYLVLVNPLAKVSSSVHTVAENQASTGIQFMHTYTVLLFLAVFGGYMMLKKKTASGIIVVVFFLTSLYFASSYIRLAELIPLSIGTLAGYGISEAFSRGRGGVRHANAMNGLLAVAVIFMILVTAVAFWVPATNRGFSITTSATSLGTSYVPAWLQAVTWMKTNTPPNSKIVSWWDYGYWIETLANRTTFIDGATINSTRMGEVATMFLTNQTNAVNIMKDLGGNYVVVFLTLRQLSSSTSGSPAYYTLGRVYGLGGDDSKYDAMAAIAGINDSLLNDPATNMPNDYFWNDTLLGHLFPVNFQGYGQFDTTTGQLVSISPTYSSQSSYYQLPLYTMNQKYPAGSSPFELVFQSSATPVTAGFVAQVFIYKFNPTG